MALTVMLCWFVWGLQFGGQEPDPVSKIRKDVKARFGVNFPIFDKVRGYAASC